jgi:hypothetical protein
MSSRSIRSRNHRERCADEFFSPYGSQNRAFVRIAATVAQHPGVLLEQYARCQPLQCGDLSFNVGLHQILSGGSRVSAKVGNA